MADNQVIDILREAYNDEIETVTNYLTLSAVLEGVSAEEVRESLRTDAKQEELGHAERIADRLHELGARPLGSFEIDPGKMRYNHLTTQPICSRLSTASSSTKTTPSRRIAR